MDILKDVIVFLVLVLFAFVFLVVPGLLDGFISFRDPTAVVFLGRRRKDHAE